jgi:cytochrome c-type biogenesis protein CcmE
MNRKKRRRIAFVIALVVAGAAGAGFVILALGKNVRYFYSPSDLAAEHVAPGIPIRIGGLVQAKSVQHNGGIEVHFVITDGNRTVPVAYTGGLPGLFREGQGIVAMGSLNRNGTFDATELLAKHDEKYEPPEVVDALKRSGHWKEGG